MQCKMGRSNELMTKVELPCMDFYRVTFSILTFQCKDSYLIPESFSAAIAEGSSELELRSLQFKIQGEIKKLQKTGVTGWHLPT